MAYKIDETADRGFLSTDRFDPYSMRMLEAGDWVIVCKSCRRVYLEQEWKNHEGCICGCQEQVSHIFSLSEVFQPRRLPAKKKTVHTVLGTMQKKHRKPIIRL